MRSGAQRFWSRRTFRYASISLLSSCANWTWLTLSADSLNECPCRRPPWLSKSPNRRWSAAARWKPTRCSASSSLACVSRSMISGRAIRQSATCASCRSTWSRWTAPSCGNREPDPGSQTLWPPSSGSYRQPASEQSSRGSKRKSRQISCDPWARSAARATTSANRCQSQTSPRCFAQAVPSL